MPPRIFTPSDLGGDIAGKFLARAHDAVWAIDGPEGSGKSVLALQIAEAVGGGKVDLERQVVYSQKEIMDKLARAEEESTVVVDDCMPFLQSRDSMTRERKTLNALFSISRVRRLCVLLVIPNFGHLDVYQRGHRCRAWLHVVYRGSAILYVADGNPFSPDPWSMNHRAQLYARALRGRPARRVDRMNALLRAPGALGIVRWDDLAEPMASEYAAFSKAAKMAQLRAAAGAGAPVAAGEPRAAPSDIEAVVKVLAAANGSHLSREAVAVKAGLAAARARRALEELRAAGRAVVSPAGWLLLA